MVKNITTPITPETANMSSANINQVIAQLKPFAAPMTNSSKTGLRTMAMGREGFVRLISNIAMQHEDSLPRSADPQDLAVALDNDTLLEKLRQSSIQLTEMITDIQLANSADIMVMTDSYADSLQRDRKNNATLETAMGEVDAWNKRFAHTGSGDAPTPPVA